jgi:hypothetical protein
MKTSSSSLERQAVLVPLPHMLLPGRVTELRRGPRSTCRRSRRPTPLPLQASSRPSPSVIALLRSPGPYVLASRL